MVQLTRLSLPLVVWSSLVTCPQVARAWLFQSPLIEEVKQGDLIVDAEVAIDTRSAPFDPLWVATPRRIIQGKWAEGVRIRLDLPRGEIYDGPNVREGRYCLILKQARNGTFDVVNTYSRNGIPAIICMLTILQKKQDSLILQDLAALVLHPDTICPSARPPYNSRGFELDFVFIACHINDRNLVQKVSATLPPLIYERCMLCEDIQDGAKNK